ncbi:MULTISPECIES: RsmB/NOP family class I SAM-dependent RNA methyltransferase [Ahrensia]|uniref:RsmB/NOP family class I SAM-dependent RNA methyltransferase n=1 Tax=Ahrensia kielensis TaxID=76980 RepID=A0ABU9T7N3_9HYPH|nr:MULTISPECIES: RsmB/NOP family class I SAM-dependent RNA methyltransferase [Ahrensia]
MRLGGRIQAAIEVLQDMESRNRPVSVALKDWGNNHRFAGSGDRNAIGNLVYDALRKRASTGYMFGGEDAEALIFGTLLRQWGMSLAQIQEALADDKFAPEIPVARIEAASQKDLAFMPSEVEADVPAWVSDHLEEAFGDEWVEEAKALAERPPLDMRVNTLKAEREKVLKQLSKQGAKPSKIARQGMRISAKGGASRMPNVTAEPAFQKGWFEVQDEGSQIVADLVFAQGGEQVFDYCAGAGGKTLALAATMDNKGQVHAYDADKQRLAPIFDRLKRAGTRNVQVHAADAEIDHLHGSFDRVVVDAPCTGSGTWRRHPDAKWKLTEDQLESRKLEQAAILDTARNFVKPGGYLCYITCSIFQDENEDQIYAFGDRHDDFDLLGAGEVWEELFGTDAPKPWTTDFNCVTLTPRTTGTDGFFFAVLQRLK